jgi:hypothetical protein
MLNRKSKLKTRNKLLLYKVGLRPTLTYAAPVIHQNADTHIKKLQVFQNKIIKTALNVSFRTSTEDINKTAQIEPIKIFIQKLTDKFNLKKNS